MIAATWNSRHLIKNIVIYYCSLVCVGLLYRSVIIGTAFYRETTLNDFYQDASHNILHKYDTSRRRHLLNGLKISSSTYNDDTVNEEYGGLNNATQKENAVLLMLVRNWELPDALKSMRSLEDRFNKDFHYDWVFLNDVPFDERFIEATTMMASGKTKYSLIPAEDWNKPDWIDERLFESRLEEMEKQKIIYGGSKSYRNMCRFNSGFFFRQKVLDEYDYYFRVEPDVEYFCDFAYDPFEIMRTQNKKYGFVMTLVEYKATIPTLWDAVLDYINHDNHHDVDKENSLYEFITDWDDVRTPKSLVEPTDNYNMCHFWSNFEIGDLNFFRSDRYLRFFNHLDATGGFYYERWGDAPVHSIAAAILLNQDEVIHFDEISYMHAPYFTLPQADYFQLKQRCICPYKEKNRIDFRDISCLNRWWKDGSGKKFMKETYPSNRV